MPGPPPKKSTRKRGGEHVELTDKDLVEFDHPGIRMENREQARLLFAAIDKLPANQRVAFTLHKLENLSYEEISAVMERSISSVESLIHRAKHNLRKLLSTYYYGKKQ